MVTADEYNEAYQEYEEFKIKCLEFGPITTEGQAYEYEEMANKRDAAWQRMRKAQGLEG
jgi:hypothetical protein